MPAKLATSYETEREALLTKIVGQAQADSRIAAAWLFGSLGRGAADALSDLDVWLVVRDEQIHELVEQRREWVAGIGTPVLLLEAPQNAPPSGGYLLACYDAPTAPHQVDWYWQPQSLARVPAVTRLLFDRVSLPRVDLPSRLVAGGAHGQSVEEPLNSMSFFWAMLMICAKNIYRAPEAEVALLRYVRDALRRVEHRVGLEPAALDAGPPGSAQAALADLRRLGQRMQAAMSRVAGLGITVPDRAALAAFRYLEFVEALIADTRATQ